MNDQYLILSDIGSILVSVIFVLIGIFTFGLFIYGMIIDAEREDRKIKTIAKWKKERADAMMEQRKARFK